MQRHAWYYLEDKSEYQYAATLVRSGNTVLDIGCGNGAFAAAIPHARFVGLELNQHAADEARQKGLDVRVQTVEEHMSANASRYDVVTAFQVVEHVVDVKTFIESAIACAKPGGKVIISVPSGEGYLAYSTNSLLNMPPHHLTRWSDATLRRLARLFAIELVAIEHEPLSPIHVQAFSTSTASAVINGMLFRRIRVLDRSFSQRVVNKIGRIVAAAITPPISLLRERLYGHSVTAVYRIPA
jgi:SAM-dependent methyltransferase